MAEKYIGLFPYLYLEQPLRVGPIEYTPILLNERRGGRRSADDNRHLMNLLKLFKDGLGDMILGATYFINDIPKTESIETLLIDLQESLNIFRFSLLSSQNKSLSFEQTFLYLFDIPPIYDNITEGKNSYDYRCLINFQNDIYTHNNMKLYPPVPDMRTSIIYKSDFYNIKQLISGYYGRPLGLTAIERERINRAIDWYNQTFQKHPIRDERGKIVDMATAFEVLLDLPRENVSGAFCSCIQALLGSSEELYSWGKRFYDARSEVVHSGKARTLRYKHPEAATEHVSLLYCARRIFVWCVDTMLGEIRGEYIDDINNLFTSNEVYLGHLMKAKSYSGIKEQGLLEEVVKLRPAYPVGKREHIISLGKWLLKAYKDQYLTRVNKPIPTLDLILNFQDSDTMKLGVLYNDFLKEFDSIYYRYISMGEGDTLEEQLKELKPEPISDLEQLELESAIHSYSQFAGFALLVPDLK